MEQLYSRHGLTGGGLNKIMQLEINRRESMTRHTFSAFPTLQQKSGVTEKYNISKCVCNCCICFHKAVICCNFNIFNCFHQGLAMTTWLNKFDLSRLLQFMNMPIGLANKILKENENHSPNQQVQQRIMGKRGKRRKNRE